MSQNISSQYIRARNGDDRDMSVEINSPTERSQERSYSRDSKNRYPVYNSHVYEAKLNHRTKDSDL